MSTIESRIGEIKNISPIIITQNGDGSYYLKSSSTKWDFTCSSEQYEVIKHLFEVYDIRKPYSRSVLRTKMKVACNSLNETRFIMANELNGKKTRPERSFLHITGSVTSRQWKELTSFLTSMHNKNILTYAVIGSRIINFNNGGNFEDIKTHSSNSSRFKNDTNLSVYIGIDSLAFFKYLSLNSLRIIQFKIDGDYSYYAGSNSTIKKINDELEGTY